MPEQQTIRIRIATQNVKDFNPSLSYADSRTLIGRVIRTVGDSGLIGLQEIGTDHHKKALADEARSRGWHFTFGGDPERSMDAPVAWNPKRWRFLGHGRKHLHDRIEGLPSPARWATWVRLEHKATGIRVALISCHPVSGAWSASPKAKQPQRVEHWLEAQKVLDALVERLSADGTPVVLVGDMNRRQSHPRGWVIPDGSHGLDVDAATRKASMAIDHIYLIGERERTWKSGPLHTERTASDHALRWVEATLTAPAKATASTTTPHTETEPDVATSQNGWPGLASNSRLLHTWTIPGQSGTTRLRMRNGSAGFLLAHLALWFDAKVEDLVEDVLDDWAYAYRPVRGYATLSNHASGTAIDLNATDHPLGAVGTFTKTEVAAIQRRLALYKGCIRWGGNYGGRKDEMHFEIDATLGECEKVARALLDTPRGKRILAANPGQRAVILS